MSTTPPEPGIPLGEEYSEIRAAIRAICADFPGEYWRDLDARDGYPEEFVNVLTRAGYLAALIPEEFGGVGLAMRAAGVILEECHAAGCYAAACHAQMYTMGTLLRHGSAGAEAAYLPRIASGELRLQAFGVTEPTTRHRHDEAQDPRGPRRRSLRRRRARRSGSRARCTPT